MNHDDLTPKLKLYTCAILFQQGGHFKVYGDSPFKSTRTARLYITFPDRDVFIFFRRVVDPEFTDGELIPTKDDRLMFQVGNYRRCKAILKPLLPYLWPKKRAAILAQFDKYEKPRPTREEYWASRADNDTLNNDTLQQRQPIPTKLHITPSPTDDHPEPPHPSL